MPDTKKFFRQDVQLENVRELYRGFFRCVEYTLKHRLFAGGWSQPIKREVLLRGEAVGILLFDPKLDAVCLLEQFRAGALHESAEIQVHQGTHQESPWLLELVAGIIDKQESPEEVAKREALEEAGLEVLAVEKIAEYFSSPGGTDEYFYVYCGQADLSSAGGIHGLEEENEDILVHVVPFSDAVGFVEQGLINNSHTLIAMQWLQLNRERLREQWL